MFLSPVTLLECTTPEVSPSPACCDHQVFYTLLYTATPSHPPTMLVANQMHRLLMREMGILNASYANLDRAKLQLPPYVRNHAFFL
jgi:hypothetical protein